MKRLFGGQNGTTAISSNDMPSEASNMGLTAAAAPSSSSTKNLQVHQAPIYNRASSYVAPSIASQMGNPHTPSASSAYQNEYFPYSPQAPALSPVNSRLAPNRSRSPQISQSIGTISGQLTPVQNIAPAPLVQRGAAAVISDASNSLTNMQAHALERNDLHKGVKSLEGLLVSLDEYRDLKVRLAKCEKKLAKGLDELGKAKAVEECPSKTLQAASDIFEARMDVSSKQAKLIQKEYDSLNEHCAKYFKRIAKEERAVDEELDSLDSKMKKAQASHDKNAKKGSKSAIESHDKFIQTMQGLTSETARLKTAHASSIGTKTFLTSLVVAATMGGLAEGEYKSLCESVRRSGQYIGTLHEWLNFASSEAMANVQPANLGDDGMGLAQKIAAKEADIREELQRQEQARLKQLEQEHAMLKLQQMGWTPPTSQTQRSQQESQAKDKRSPTEASSVTFANLPKLDSNGNLVAVAEKGNAEEQNSPQQGRTLSQSEPKPDKSRSSQSYSHLHHLQASSIAEGTVIIKDVEPDEKEAGKTALESTPEEPEFDDQEKQVEHLAPSSDDAGSSLLSATPTGLSLSTSASTQSRGSEDSSQPISEARSAGPLTPIEEKVDDVIVRTADEHEKEQDIIEEKSFTESEPKIVAPPTAPSVATTALTPTEKRDNLDSMSRVQSPPLSSRTAHEYKPSPVSLWDREQERVRQTELEKRLAEAENRLRMLDRPDARPAQSQRPSYDYNNDHDLASTRDGLERKSTARPRFSEPAPSAQRHYENEIPASRYEPDRYAPAVGGSRISGQGISRSLSTDSERSFVARMKAVYQAERSDKQQEPYPSSSYRRPTGQGEMESTRRVSEMANAYARKGEMDSRPSANAPYQQDMDRHQMSPPPGTWRSRYDSAPSQPQRGGRVDEFGSQYADAASTRRNGNEPVHAKSCGCWNCSARHYRNGETPVTTGASIGMAQTKAGILPPQPPPRHPNATNSLSQYPQSSRPPSGQRRQTMQELPNEVSYGRSNGPKTLVAPANQLYNRRSFEDEPAYRPNYAKEHGTIR